ncbi:hypothetical protein H6F73_01555 [Microcoleus sp. FACHB-68]|nr:hypothetical protein [Microcoleus sp. FACHB-68]
MNNLSQGGDDLVSVDYENLLEKILEVLQNQQNPFNLSEDGNRLLIDIDTVAAGVASMPMNNPLGASANSAQAATVNFSPGFSQRFPTQIRQIRDRLQQLIELAIPQENFGDSIEDFVNNLISNLESFKGDEALDFTYPFDNKYKGLQKQRITFRDNEAGTTKLLKFHKLTITVGGTGDFNAQLRKSLENYIKVQFAGASEQEREDLGYVLEDLVANQNTDFYTLKRILDTETLGKLKKQAQIHYLEFLRDNINTGSSNTNTEGAIYLEVLIRRLLLINQYIDDVEKPDGDYQVSYAGESVNYRDWFSRADAFERLPIIPIIDGYLGESKDENRGELKFIFGLKLKFGGPVQTFGGKRVFDYYLDVIDPNSKLHQAELADPSRRKTFATKVLTTVFLYYFVFAGADASASDYTPNLDLEYNPIPRFEKALLILRGSDDAAKESLLRGMRRGFEKYKVKSKINKLKQVLKNLLEHKTSFPTEEYPLHIYVKTSLLERDIDTICNRGTFFKEVLRGNSKQVLKYISVEKPHTRTNALITLPASITITDVHYFSTDDQQSFSMEYDIKGVRGLPVLLVSKDDRCRKVYGEGFQKRKLIAFPYSLERNNLESQPAFIYRFTFSLLVYICMKLLLNKQKMLFIPILRLQVSNKEDDSPIETFMLGFSMVLSHLLNQEHRANAQGIDISRSLNFKIKNAMSSLYSVLPKKFRFTDPLLAPEIDKLAIIIVSSRESDRRWGSSQKISNLMGEIVGVVPQTDGSVRIQLLRTFSANYDSQQMFTEPTAISDEIHKLYDMGFRHFLYIAKAPYSSTLHMTQREEDDGLFFMSRDVIRHLKADYTDIKIYPMFFDKYYAVKLAEKLEVSSLYIQDTMELTALVDAHSKQSVVFFNLFNGITISTDDRHYNGVISYATLLNIYQNLLDDEDIRKGLISEGALKNQILQYLSLFHFSRYQAFPKKNQPISFKLDPYDNLIGDYSVGARSFFKHMTGNGTFNFLAFLTEVRRYLNAPGDK